MTVQEKKRKEWFDQLYEKHYRLLYNHARWRIECFGFSKGMIDELAHEAVQMTFAAAWEKVEELILAERPGAWLAAVLKNKLIDLAREEIRMNELRDKLEQRLQSGSPNDIRETEFLVFLKETLTGEERELVHRIYVNLEKPSDICNEMGIKRSALSMRLHRIKKKIKKFLKL